MKKVFLITLSLLLIITGSSYAQSRINESRRTTNPVHLQEYNRQIKVRSKSAAGVDIFQAIPKYSKFTIVDENDLDYIIYLWDWDKGSPNYALNYSGNEQIYFAIPKNALEKISEKIFKKYSPVFGAMTYPFRYRPQSGIFEKNFSLGAAGGVKIDPARVNEHTFSILLGVAASSVPITKFNTDPAGNITDPSDRGAVTISLNFLYQWEHLQIGLSTGIDNLLENETVKWRYQSKPWLSLGIGISLFTSNEITTPGKN